MVACFLACLLGLAWLGLTWLGLAWLGLARLAWLTWLARLDWLSWLAWIAWLAWITCLKHWETASKYDGQLKKITFGKIFEHLKMGNLKKILFA